MRYKLLLTDFCGFAIAAMPPSPQDDRLREFPSRAIYWDRPTKTLVFTKLGVESLTFAALHVRALFAEEHVEVSDEMVQQLLSQVRRYYWTWP